MILHIVRSGESIKMIADNYQCEISDITSNNLHITDFKNLKAGMKLRIPFLTKPIMETLEETESFISDYYPSLDANFKDKKKKEEKKEEQVIPIPIEIENEEVIEVTEEIKEEIKRDIKKEVITPNLNQNNLYYGNVIPNIPEKYIKKI